MKTYKLLVLLWLLAGAILVSGCGSYDPLQPVLNVTHVPMLQQPATYTPGVGATPLMPVNTTPPILSPAVGDLSGTQTSGEITLYPTLPATLYYATLPSPTLLPTPLPGVLVRIRNWTEGPINLYRWGRSNEIHYLGWLNPRFYGEFRFPMLGEWRIRYCARDRDGNDLLCKEKWIEVTQDGQEFRVP